MYLLYFFKSKKQYPCYSALFQSNYHANIIYTLYVLSLCGSEALPNKADSTLLRHELAYVLGQMQDNEAIDVLSQVLRDISDDVIVRHECAEALGAICDESVLPILTEFSKDPAIEVSETCDIAIDLVKWKMKKVYIVIRV